MEGLSHGQVVGWAKIPGTQLLKLEPGSAARCPGHIQGPAKHDLRGGTCWACEALVTCSSRHCAVLCYGCAAKPLHAPPCMVPASMMCAAQPAALNRVPAVDTTLAGTVTSIHLSQGPGCMQQRGTHRALACTGALTQEQAQCMRCSPAAEWQSRPATWSRPARRCAAAAPLAGPAASSTPPAALHLLHLLSAALCRLRCWPAQAQSWRWTPAGPAACSPAARRGPGWRSWPGSCRGGQRAGA